MKGFAALAIAAMLVVQVAVTFVGTVSATSDTATVTPDRTKVKGGWRGILTVNVANDPTSSHAIDNVIISITPAWENFAPIQLIPKDNQVTLAEDNVVYLPAGTVLEVWLDNDNIILPENSVVVVPNENSFKYPVGGTEYTLQNDNLNVMVKTEVILENVFDNENMRVPAGREIVFRLQSDNRVKLLSETAVVYAGPNLVKLPENLLVATVAPDNDNLQENENLTFKSHYLVNIGAGTQVTCLENAVSTTPSLYGTNMFGTTIELVQGLVYIPPETVVKIEGQPLAKLAYYENENVLLKEGRLVDVTGVTVENRPKGWAQYPSDNCWKGIGDNKISPGASENFPFAIKAPDAAGTYTLCVTTRYTNGFLGDSYYRITVDNSVTVNVSVDKAWVGKNENITITVSSDEPIWFDNVLVCENNAPENVNIEMSTTDNKTYTGTYTTGDNEDRDGYLTIRVINSRDEVGNGEAEIVKSDLVFVDRWRPGPPNLTALGIPVGIENQTDWPISTTLTSSHDNLIFTPSGYSPENLMLEVLVDNNLAGSGRAAPITNRVSFTLTLPEGKHTVAARITDKAGNVGEENSDNNVVIDTSKPTVTFVSPTRGKLGKADIGADNTITISLKLRDTVLGIENYEMENTDEEADNENFDRGYIVRLYKDSAVIAVLEPRSYPTLENVENVLPNVFGITADWTFENTYSLGASPQGKYTVEVIAGDSMGVQAGKGPHRVKENVSFEVDLTAPNDPDEDTCTGSLEGGKSQFEPTKTRISRLTLMGTTEPNATVKIYSSVAGGAWTVLTTASAGSDGKWSKDVDLPEGQTMGLKVSYVDEAGNESGMYLYGYLLFDDNPPTVTIDAQYKEFSTDKASVLITGRVQKDTWEDYNDIELSVAPATAAVNFNRTNGTFTVSAPVSEGTNLITVEAKDPVGNRGSDTAVVTRTVTPWATYATILVIVALVLAAVAIFRKK